MLTKLDLAIHVQLGGHQLLEQRSYESLRMITLARDYDTIALTCKLVSPRKIKR